MAEPVSRVPSTYLSGLGPGPMDEAPPLEEIGNIPTLMYALKSAIVDREKIDALKRFIDEGGDEVYYLDEKVQLIISSLLSILIHADPRNYVHLRLPNLPLAIPYPPRHRHQRPLPSIFSNNRQRSLRASTQTRKPHQSRRVRPPAHHRPGTRRGPPPIARSNSAIEVKGGEPAVEEI